MGKFFALNELIVIFVVILLFDLNAFSEITVMENVVLSIFFMGLFFVIFDFYILTLLLNYTEDEYNETSGYPIYKHLESEEEGAVKIDTVTNTKLKIILYLFIVVVLGILCIKMLW